MSLQMFLYLILESWDRELVEVEIDWPKYLSIIINVSSSINLTDLSNIILHPMSLKIEAMQLEDESQLVK